MRLIACANCHTQYDVADISAESFPCRCGATLENRPHEAVDAEVHRCGSCGALVTAQVESCDYCGSGIVRDARDLSLICPECYARSPDDARFCTACGVGFRPEKVLAGGHELPCPVCTKLMPPRQVGGIGLNECLECRGLWVPGDGFDQLVERAIESRRSADPASRVDLSPRLTGANPAQQSVRYRKCPECDGFMNRRNYRKRSGIIIDVCRNCGTWLDADELEAIAGFILEAGAAKSAAPIQPAENADERRAAAAFARITAEGGSRTDSWRERETPRAAGSLLDLLLRLFL